MTLDVCLESEYVTVQEQQIPLFRQYRGKVIEQMPQLIGETRVPMNVAQLMQRRFDVRNSYPDDKNPYLRNYFFTGDAVAYHPDGRLKIVLDAQLLREINPTSELSRSGALVLAEGVYESLVGEEFKQKELSGLDRYLSKQETKNNPILRILARDLDLLIDHTEYIAPKVNKRFSRDTIGRVALDLIDDVPLIRGWYMGGLLNGFSALGTFGFDDHVSRLIGIVPQAAETFS